MHDLSYTEWEGEVIYALENLIECTTSDAQGIIDVQHFKLSQCWGKGLKPEETAIEIDKASTSNEGRALDVFSSLNW
jgi:hypothetical protein